MADQPDKTEQTEDPTQKKLDDAHQKGDVAKSQEVTTWFMLCGTTAIIALMSPMLSGDLMVELQSLMSNSHAFDVNGQGSISYFRAILGSIAVLMLIPMGVQFALAIAANLVQHKPVWSVEPITPKFSKVSPLAGVKRLFSKDSLVNFGKGLAKLSIVATVMVIVIWPEMDRFDTMVTADPASLLAIFQEMAVKLLGATLIIVTLIAGADFFYQKNKWFEKQKMTLKEVRDEHKDMEGDPQLKAKIRQLRNERSRGRMMAMVPEASVVITNPTHYAVALKYEAGMSTPICLAKGVDAVALRIRASATDNDVPIVENPPLARALYATVELGDEIPDEHFKAVAQVIGYVMRLKERARWRA